MSRPRIVVFAYSDLGHACLSHLLDQNENVVNVYTHLDQAGESIWFPSVRKLAESRGIPVRLESELKRGGELKFIQSLKPDLIFSFYYRKLIPSAVLSLPKLGAFNMHGSLLPKYRGRAPVNWAILRGEVKTGATLHFMTEKPDQGDIVDQESVDIGPDDTSAVVQDRVTQAAVQILTRRLSQLKRGSTPRIPQDESLGSYFGRRRPEDGKIQWTKTAADIHNLVRAVSHPYPGAFGELFGEKTIVWKTRLPGRKSAEPWPGRTVAKEDGLFVACGDGNLIEILSLQRQGEEETSGLDLAKKALMASEEKIR